jgi:hypothetical protein
MKKITIEVPDEEANELMKKYKKDWTIPFVERFPDLLKTGTICNIPALYSLRQDFNSKTLFDFFFIHNGVRIGMFQNSIYFFYNEDNAPTYEDAYNFIQEQFLKIELDKPDLTQPSKATPPPFCDPDPKKTPFYFSTPPIPPWSTSTTSPAQTATGTHTFGHCVTATTDSATYKQPNNSFDPYNTTATNTPKEDHPYGIDPIPFGKYLMDYFNQTTKQDWETTAIHIRYYLQNLKDNS